MKNNEKMIREFFDGVEMSEEFREKMKRLIAEPVKKSRRLAMWKPTLIAAAVAFVCLSSFVALRERGFLLPMERPAPTKPTGDAASAIYPDPTQPAEDAASSARSDETGPAADVSPAIRPGSPSNPGRNPAPPTPPCPTDPSPTDPKPTTPPPADPQPVKPKPTEPQPTEPNPTEPQPTEPNSTEPQPTEPNPAEIEAPHEDEEPNPAETEAPIEGEEQPEYEDPIEIEDPNESFQFDSTPDNGSSEPISFEAPLTLNAVYTQTGSAQTITVTNPDTGRQAVIDVTGRVTEEGFRGWYRLFDRTVCVELIPRGEGFIPYAAVYE